MFVKRDTPSPGSDRSRDGGIHCDLCGSSNPAVRCDKCNGHAFCLSCDDMYHRHPKRKQHLRKAIDSYTSTIPSTAIRQPSGQRANVPGDPSKMPIPPPRKKKGKSFFPGFGSDIPALPKKEFSLTEKIGSIRRFMSNRPLPPIPKHEMPLQQGTIPPKPRAASPKNHQTNNQVILNNQVKHTRTTERQGSPEYQNILAHLTKVAQNSADEWEEEPSVSTSGSNRGSSGGEDIGWGQDVTPLPKSGAPPTLRNNNEEMANQNIQDWQGFGTLRRGQMQRGLTPQERMTHSTSMGNLQSGYPNQQMAGQGFYPSPYPHFYGQGAVPGQAYPGAYPNFVGQFPRGSWSHLPNRGEEDDLEGEEDEEDPSGQGIDGGTLTKANKSQMKRSQSVMYDPMMAPTGPYFPFGAVPPGYPPGSFFPPGFPPYWSQQQPGQRLSSPPSPSTSTRSLTRKTRGKSRKHLTDEETFSSDRSRGGSRRGSRAQHRKSESSDIPPSSEDEEEAPLADKRRTRKQQMAEEEPKSTEEAKDDFPVPEILEDKPPAPPPPIPTEQWECNFCTFINPPGGRVCNVCCKTISTGPDPSDEKEEETRSASPDSKGSKNDLNELKAKKKKAKEEFLNFGPDFIKEQQQLEEEIRKRLERNRRLSEGFPGEPTSRKNSVTETTVLPPEPESTESVQASISPATDTAEPSPASPQPPHSKSVTVAETSTSPIPASSPEPPITQDTVSDALSSLVNDRLATKETEINNNKIKSPTEKATKTDSSCQTIVENNQDTSQLQVHSVALGTDNVSDIEDSSNGHATKVEMGTSPIKVEMGTSPPNLVEMGTSPPNLVEMGTSPTNLVEMGTSPPNLTEDFSQNMFDRSGHFSNLQRSVSQSSLRDDLLYPSRQYQNERREDYNRGQLLRSLSRTSLASEPGMYGLTDQLNRAPDSPFIQRKNVGSDWNRRRPGDLAIRDYIPQPQMQGSWYPRERNAFSTRDSREDLLERRRQETMRVQGLEMVRLIRKAEQSGFLPDDLQVALNHCGPDQDPIDWLEENWTNMIETVVTLATNYGHDKPDNDVGIISAGEAKEALRLHRGNIWASVTECVESRQRKYHELRARGNFSRREIVAALTANQGNLELAYSELTRSLHKPFSLNVWGPGSGVENYESARLPTSDVQGKGLFDRFDPLEAARSSILQHRKQHLGESTNIHRSMLNLNMIGLEDDFRPLNVPGASPRLARRFSFTSGRTNDFAGFSPNFNRMNQTKTNYDASDSMSMTSEDLEFVDAPAKKDTLKERGTRETTRGNRHKKISRSTTFLNKLASLRKNKPKPQTENQGGVKTEPESDNSESEPRLKRQGKSASVQQLSRSMKEDKPQRRSFLQRMIRGNSPDVIIAPQGSQDVPKDEAQMPYDNKDNLDSNIQTLNSQNLQDAHEVSSIEKVQAFLEKMPEDAAPKPEPKMGFLQRLGLKSTKKDREGSTSSPVSSADKNLSPNESKEYLITPSGSRVTAGSSTFYTNMDDMKPLKEIPASTAVSDAAQTNLSESSSARVSEEIAPDSASNKELQSAPKVESIATARSRFFGITPDNETKEETVAIAQTIDGIAEPETKETESTSDSSNRGKLEKQKESISESSTKIDTAKTSKKTEEKPASKQTTVSPENVSLPNISNESSSDYKLDIINNQLTPQVQSKGKEDEVSKFGVKTKAKSATEKSSAKLAKKPQEPKMENNSEVATSKAKLEESKLDSSVPSKVESSAPLKVESSAPLKVESSAPLKVESAAPLKVESSAPSKVESSLATPTLSSDGRRSPKEERVIRRQVKEELIEEREKTNDNKSEAKGQTKKTSDGHKPKAEIVQTKLEIVETIVEIVKPRDDKGKSRADKLVSPPKEIYQVGKKDLKEPTKYANLKEIPKDLKTAQDKPTVSGTSSQIAKKSEDISYPVSRFAKPRDPLFSFKPSPQSQLVKEKEFSKTQPESIDETANSTAEKRMEIFSSPPTSPTTVLPLKSILKKTSVTEMKSLDQTPVAETTTESDTTNERAKDDISQIHSYKSDEPVVPTNDRPNTANDNLRSTIDGTDTVNDKPSTTKQSLVSASRNEPTSASAKSISPKEVNEINELNAGVQNDHAIPQHDSQSKHPSSSIKSTAADELDTSSPTSSANDPESSKVPDIIPSESEPSSSTNAEDQKPMRRRRRMSDVEDSSLQAPQQSTFPRRRRSMSTDRPSSAIYRTRERKTESIELDDANLLLDPELELALKDDDKSNEESNEAMKSETDSKLAAPRVRRQRSISRDRLSRTPSATDSGKEGLVGSTSDILKKAKPEALVRQDSFRERRRSMSFDVNKGRFASSTITKSPKAVEGADSKERSRTPSKSVRQLSPLKTSPKSEKKGKEALKPINASAPVMSSKRLVLDTKIKDLMSEGKCETYEQAETAARLIEMNFDEEEALEASKECGTLYQAISYLSQDCELCAGKFPVADMVSMVNCTHRACRDCLKAYFTIQIRDRNIMELICPFCNEPDLTNDDIASDYFNHMDLILKNFLDQDIHELFHRKLRDRVLMKDPLFRWCSQCSSGFIITNPNQKRLLCPDCKAVTCASCRKRWEKQHEGLTCEKYLAWKEANDPEIQAAGLAQHLAENGIDCPNCHFRYSLAKGGCMHFRCVQCQYDFCSGCGKPFKMGQKCGVSEFCSKLGLHAHHPRNCLFYLRDKEPAELQKLLDQFTVAYNTEPPDGMEVKDLCQVNEQKEVAEGLKDDICGKDVMDGYAGLCRIHYIEYLSGLIKRNNLDPINMFNEDELELCLKRATLKLPPRPYGTTAKKYRELLLKTIKDQLPLEKIEGT